MVVFLLVTVLGCWFGLAYADLVHRRFAMADVRSWLLLVPAWVLYAVILATDTSPGIGVQAVQSIALSTILATLVSAAPALARRSLVVGAP